MKKVKTSDCETFFGVFVEQNKNENRWLRCDKRKEGDDEIGLFAHQLREVIRKKEDKKKPKKIDREEVRKTEVE